MSKQRRCQWIAAGLALLALAMRLITLDAQSLWADEGITYAWATLPWRQVLPSVLLVGDQVPLYYAVMRLWVRMVGTSAFALRFPSAWAAALTVPVVYLAGKRARGRTTGLLAAALLAFNPYHIWYAQDARMYALALLASTAVLIAFAEALRRPGWRWWAVLAVTSAVAYLVHYFTFTLAAAQLVVILADFGRLYRRFRRWVVAQAVAALPTVVWVAAACRMRGTTRLPGGWIPRPAPLAPLYTLFNYSLGYEKTPSTPLLLGYALFVAAFLLAFRSRATGRWRQALLAYIALPVGGSFLISLRRPIYVDRYLSVLLPAFLLWIALGVATLPHRWRSLGAAALVVASLLAAVATAGGYRYRKQDWHAAVTRARQQAHRGDELFVANPMDVPVAHYYLDDAMPISVGPPEAIGDGRSWFLYRVPIPSNHVVAEVSSFEMPRDAEPEIRTWLSAHADDVVARWDYPGLALFLVEGDRSQ